MLKKLEEANAQMKSDMEKMQEELDTEEQLRKRQEEQVVHNKPLFITSDLLLFIALIWGEKTNLFFVRSSSQNWKRC